MPPKVLPNFPEPSNSSGDKKPIPEGKPNCLEGIKFVISGTLPSLSRKEAQKLIEKYGGNFASSISKKTDVLVCGSLEEASTKVKKAKELNIKITDEDGLFTVIRGSNSNISDSNSTTSELSTNTISSNNETNKLSITNQEDLSDLLSLQNLLYSDSIDVNSLQITLEDLKKKYSIQDIDHQLILAFSLDYSKIPTLIPFLSKKFLNKDDFIHADQELIFHLIEADITFPLLILWEKCLTFLPFCDQDDHYPWNPCRESMSFEVPTFQSTPAPIKIEAKLLKKFEQCPRYKQMVESSLHTFDDDFDLYGIHEKEEIEDIIENDDLERLRDFTANSEFDFDGTIYKENILFDYNEIPYLSYCIEKNAMKCFKFLFINGSDPLKKSQVPETTDSDGYGCFIYDEENIMDIWDAFGFAGASGNIQFVKILQEKVNPITQDIILGCTKFHKNNILSWVLKENPSFAKYGLINSIKYENIQALNQLLLNPDSNFDLDVNLTDRFQKTPLHYASRAKLFPIAKILIQKGSNINAHDCCNNSPLHEAAKSDSLEIAQLLRDNNANIDDENQASKTPLDHTAQLIL